ncbi:MAG: hypothetical protein E7080_05190 [Bacteroidales bacterium]|nr:hypothetical protein [Bacteroidales bacterium]
MKRLLSAIILSMPFVLSAQSAIDVFSVSQTDLKGTARFVSMAGAFGALGGDLSAVQQNPGGIGVYRRSDVGLTFNVDMQSTESVAREISPKISQTKCNISNIGYVGTIERNSGFLPFLNFGVSYNRPVSYNRHYGGKINDLKSSLSNYIADVTNRDGYMTKDLINNRFNPYKNSDASWLSIMACNSHIINPKDFDNKGIGYNFKGLLNARSTGFSEYEVIEEGGINEFDVNIGGNISNVIYCGFGVGFSDVNFSKYTYYGEAINNATVKDNDGLDKKGTASWQLENWLKTSGSGWNFKMGVIARPCNEIRLGLAFHLPTHYSLKDEIRSTIHYETINSTGNNMHRGYVNANNGNTDEVKYKIKTPWRLNLSAAAVLSDKAIISTSYERVAYNIMSLSYRNENGDYVKDIQLSKEVSAYYEGMNIFRVGGEYRLLPTMSLRLGYAYYNSPVRKDAMEDRLIISTSGTNPAYTLDKATQYVTGGVGIVVKNIYVDFAYVLKMRESEYRAFTPYNIGPSYESSYKLTPAPSATVKDYNNQMVCTIGYRF